MPEAKLKNEEDFLNLPDDELPDYPPEDAPEDAEEAVIDSEGEDKDDTIDDTTDTEEDADDDDDDNQEADDDEPGDRGDSDGDIDDELEESDEEDVDSEGEQPEAGSETEEEAPKKGKVKKSKTVEKEVTLGADTQLKQLFAPFKANGRDMQVSSVDDAITLMKMGANYNKKMQGLKPNLRLMKMLDNNKLLDEEKLSYLIDLENKNPQAIAKLIKDSGFDPIDHDEDNTDYTPGTYTVNDNEVKLDMVLDDIKDTPSFQETIDTISTKWDAASRKFAENDPEIIRKINDHISTGVYGKIMDIVQNEKSLNRLTEMSDLQAYKHVGDTLQAQGAFAPQPAANEKKPSAKKPQDPKLKNRKKAAANTRSKPGSKQQAFDPLSLSDEDFAKLDPALI